jgi:NAD(P)-dependent dehydrogenase (short-subunit alcohol dehydrogenase family)
VVQWLHQALVAGQDCNEGTGPDSEIAASPNGESAARQNGDGAAPAPNGTIPARARRFVPRLVELPAVATWAPEGLLGTRVIVMGHALPQLSELFTRHGAAVATVSERGQIGPCDLLVDLRALSEAGQLSACDAFMDIRDALLHGVSRVVAVTATGGQLSMDGPPPNQRIEDLVGHLGMRGMIKTLAREVPAVRARLVDIDPAMSADHAASGIIEEIMASDDVVEVGRTGHARVTVAAVPAELPDRTDSMETLGLSPDAVILVIGGGRGITARLTVELSARVRCRLVVAGRTPEPAVDEDPATAAAPDEPSLRRQLVTSGAARGLGPAAIEAEVRRILAEREVRRTLTAAGSGASLEYRQVDARDGEAVRTLVQSLYTCYGRIDGVVHGAGIIEDARLLDKSEESFRRVFDTKVTPALALCASLREDVRFVVFYGSVSGLFGNIGQIDYAAANDALAELARVLQQRAQGRVVTLDWGPWAEGGMVSPQLEREFARRGVGLLDPVDAMGCLLAELGSPIRDPEVAVMRSAPEAFAARPATFKHV